MAMIWKSVLLLSLSISLPSALASPKKHGGGHKGQGDTQQSTVEYSFTPSSAPPLRNHSTSELHTPFTENATTTGALTATSIGTTITSADVPAGATSYPADGNLHHAEPVPFEPAGGVGTNGSTPVYNARSDFDYESLVSSQVKHELATISLGSGDSRRISTHF